MKALITLTVRAWPEGMCIFCCGALAGMVIGPFPATGWCATWTLISYPEVLKDVNFGSYLQNDATIRDQPLLLPDYVNGNAVEFVWTVRRSTYTCAQHTRARSTLAWKLDAPHTPNLTCPRPHAPPSAADVYRRHVRVLSLYLKLRGVRETHASQRSSWFTHNAPSPNV